MGQIYFRQFYTVLIEQYLRGAVRKWYNSRTIPKKWVIFADEWIENLSDEDKEFIRFVFDKQNYNSYMGVSRYGGDFLLNHKRLYSLERRFAIDAGLLSDISDEEKMEMSENE